MFVGLLVLEALEEFFDLEVGCGDAGGWGDCAVEDVLEAVVGSGAFECGDVQGFFDYADEGSVSVGVLADVAGGLLGDVCTYGAEFDA